MTRRRRTKAELILELGMEFRQEHIRVQAFDELAAERLGINLTDLRCLDLIEQYGGDAAQVGTGGAPTDRSAGPITAGELAEAAHLTSGAMTAVLDRLEGAGYASRIRDPGDRRRVRIELTPKAREVLSELYEPRGWGYYRLFDRYTVDELSIVLDLMRRSAAVSERQLERLKGEEE